MQILLNETNTVLAYCTVGGFDGGLEVENIPEEVKANCTTFKYMDGEFIKDTSIELEQVKSVKLEELSTACANAITAGFDVDGKHYSFFVEDQTNILAWAEQAKAGNSVPYHADGELCRVYTAAEFLQIVGVATYYKVSQQTYHNCLKQQVLAMIDVDAVKTVQYGITELTGTYKETYDVVMEAISGEKAV